MVQPVSTLSDIHLLTSMAPLSLGAAVLPKILVTATHLLLDTDQPPPLDVEDLEVWENVSDVGVQMLAPGVRLVVGTARSDGDTRVACGVHGGTVIPHLSPSCINNAYPSLAFRSKKKRRL